MKLMVAAVLIAGLPGCSSIGPPVVSNPPAACVIDPALVGTWTDFRMTQFGPGWMTYAFRCDCTVETRVQLLWTRVTERARYSASGGDIRFERSGGAMTHPYRFEGGRLVLTEAAAEVYAHVRRGAPVDCPARSS